MNERVKKLSEEIRKLSPDEQADLMDELLVLTYREPDPEIEKVWGRRSTGASMRSSVGRRSSSMLASTSSSTRNRDSAIACGGLAGG